MALIYNASFDSQTRVLSLLDKAGNVISSCEVPSKEPLVDDITKPLTFRAIQDGSTVKLVKAGSPSGAFQTSRDGGNTWSDYTIGASITLNTGDKVSFRAKADRSSAQSTQNYFNFSMKGKIEAWHNVMSLYRTNDFATYESVAVYAFYRLFRECTSLIKSPALPATTLANYCYTSMFSGCTSLIKSPALPATTLAYGCYQYMLWGCTSLTKAPSLPATTLADKCYYQMFYGCSKLKEVRVSATTTATQALTDWLAKVSSTGDFYCDPNATIFPTGSASGIPSGWNRRDINLLNALTLTATADNSSVKLTKNGTLDNTFEVDTGNGWEGYAFGTVIPLNAGQSCKWRCKSHPTTQSDSNYVQFVMTGKIEASGNVNSMLSRGFENLTSLSGYDYAFKSMFNRCTSLVQAPELPATNLATYCYGYMFYGCTSLVQAPELPATTLATNCYTCMFNSCTSLVQAPELPATTLATYCYYYMFNGCTSLVQAPELPATNLATYCYGYMFRNCTSLTQAPSLPATALAHNCYAFMFYGCTSLVQAPSLPATTLANFCYEHMFTGCTPLNEVRISATTTATNALNYWLAGVSATGDFYCDPNATIFQSGDSGIPANWTRHALADYPVTP